MKIKTGSQSSGIVLVATLATILIIAIVLTSYAILANQINSSVARSQSWNQAIPVLEAGVEEALTQLHYAGTNSLALTSNNWTYGADGMYHKTRTFSDGSYYDVSIQPTTLPVIFSTGYVIAPVPNYTSTATNYVSRRVRAIAQTTGIPGGLAAKSSITMSGAGTLLDSFNSQNPLYNTGGLYDPAKRESDAIALTDSTSAGAINIGTATVYGNATTGPGGTVTSNGHGTVTGQETDDANAQFNDVSAPFVFGTATVPSSGAYTVGGTTYDYDLGSGNYNISSLTLKGSGMLISGNVTLYINGSFTMNGGGSLVIAPGASLTLYLNGDASITGGGTINNLNGLASKCTIYGLPGCSSFGYAGGAAFIGTVYAPEAAISLSGGASVSGALVGDSIRLTGGAQVHYDESLGSLGNVYVVTSWNEY